jgi:hypothetical protein
VIPEAYDAGGDAADAARRGGDHERADNIDDAADDLADALEDAEAAHVNGDKDERDAAMKRASDAADKINDNAGTDVGEQVKRNVQANRNRFDADDNRVEPMDRDEGRNRVADAFAKVQKRLRGEGREGRKKARDLRNRVGGFEDAIDLAERADNDEDRDRRLDLAQDFVDQVVQDDPELGEVMQEVLNGQAARMRAKSAPSSDGGDAHRARHQEALQQLQGIDLGELHDRIRSDPYTTAVPGLPDGWTIDRSFHSSGNIGEVYRLVDPDGNKFYLKHDTEAGQHEVPYMQILQEIGGYPDGVKVPAFLGNADGYDQQYFILGDAGGDGVSGIQEVADAFRALPSDSIWANRGFAIKKIGLSDWNFRNPDDIVRLLLMNALGGNTDRHMGNAMYGVDSDGYGIIAPIDHGRVFNNGDIYSRDWASPWDAVTGDGGGSNPNQFARAFVERMREDRSAGVAAYDKTIDDMEAMLQRDDIGTPDLRAELLDRMQWLRDNRDDFIDRLDRKVTG